MKINWGLVCLILFSVIVLAFAILTLPKKNNNFAPNQLLLESCKQVIKELTSEDLSNISPEILPVGPAVQHGPMRYQNLVLWKNDEFDVEVKCFARSSKSSSQVIVDRLMVNGEDKTDLVRREERKK